MGAKLQSRAPCFEEQKSVLLVLAVSTVLNINWALFVPAVSTVVDINWTLFVPAVSTVLYINCTLFVPAVSTVVEINWTLFGLHYRFNFATFYFDHVTSQWITVKPDCLSVCLSLCICLQRTSHVTLRGMQHVSTKLHLPSDRYFPPYLFN
jgi:hypothetical protein